MNSKENALWSWLFAPQPLIRLEAVRILVPLAILGFMASRVWYADHWISDAGFYVPEVGPDDWRQPIYIPPVSVWGAWFIVATLVASGVGVVLGLFTRASCALFCMSLFYVALADRLAAFTVSKIGPLLVLALFFTPCGARYSIDAWRKRRAAPANEAAPTLVSGGNVRIFQLFLAVFYFSSGVCKAHGDWLTHPNILWTYLHDSYQTSVSLFFANNLPDFFWGTFQWVTLVFEYGAPLWFGLRWTRPFALAYGVSMHLMIGLMFGPVIWFSLLMIALLLCSYAPEPWLRLQRRPKDSSSPRAL